MATQEHLPEVLPNPPPGHPEPSGKKTPPAGGVSGLGRLAAQMAQWTTRGLLCAVIVVACVGFGRQVLQWWAEESPPPSKPTGIEDPLAGIGEENRLHIFRFANAPWELRRQIVVGDAKKAFRQLKAICAQATANVPAGSAVAGPQEQRFLQILRHQEPVERGVGWAVYAFRENVPLVVGIQNTSSASNANPNGGDRYNYKWELPLSGGKAFSVPEACPVSEESNFFPTDRTMNTPKGGKIERKAPPFFSEGSSEVAPSFPRVVSWGLGIPNGPDRWTLYVVVATSGESRVSGGEEIPIPPEGILICSLGVPQGGQITLFGGPPRPETWKNFYQTYFLTHGGTLRTPWQQEGSRWRAQFLWRGGGKLSSGRVSPPKKVEIAFGPQTNDWWSGLIWIWAEESAGN